MQLADVVCTRKLFFK